MVYKSLIIVSNPSSTLFSTDRFLLGRAEFIISCFNGYNEDPAIRIFFEIVDVALSLSLPNCLFKFIGGIEFYTYLEFDKIGLFETNDETLD